MDFQETPRQAVAVVVVMETRPQALQVEMVALVAQVLLQFMRSTKKGGLNAK